MNGPRCPLCGDAAENDLAGAPCERCIRGLAQPIGQAITIGAYELLDPQHPIGRGATANVYIARHTITEELVALKVASTKSSPALFQHQARLEKALRHPNIVSVHGAGMHADAPFLVMTLMEGGDLAKHAVRHAPLEARLDVLAKVARAVQYAHALGILHCDIKKENILFDERGEPRLCDFGMARMLSASGEAPVLGGTPGWMSPEQARAFDSPCDANNELLKTTSDVFALGILVHWLTTTEMAFGSGRESIRRVQEDPPPALPPFEPGVEWGLRAIAHRAMQKKPEARYASAADLAEDLERLQAGLPLLGVSLPLWGRVLRRCYYFPVRTALLLFCAVFLPLSALFVVSSEEEVQRREIRKSTEVAAGLGARSLLLHFIELAHQVQEAAAQPELIAAYSLAEPERSKRLHAFCAVTLRRYNSGSKANTGTQEEIPFRFWAAYDNAGIALAHTLVTYGFTNANFSGREYFRGAKALAERGLRQAHFSSVFIGTSTREFEFTISAPIFASNGSWLGVLVASVLTTAELGSVPLDDPRYTAVVAGPEDPSSGPLVPPIQLPAATNAIPSYRIFRHPKLKRGISVVLANEQIRRAANAKYEDRIYHWQETRADQSRGQAIADYVDPLGEKFPEYEGQRLAAFAPVGQTGYVLIVQSNENDPLGVEKRFLARLTVCAAKVAVPGLILVLLAMALQHAERSRRANRRASLGSQSLSTAQGTGAWPSLRGCSTTAPDPAQAVLR